MEDKVNISKALKKVGKEVSPKNIHTLSTEQIVYIKSILPFALGFSENFVVCWLSRLH